MIMMSDLPLDLLEEILSRVPAASIKRLRSTCKRWNALFKDQRFTEKQFRKAPKESLVLMLKKYRVCSININLNVASPFIELKGALGLKDSHSYLEEVNIYEVFHCDGLLLCITTDNRPVVWNPCLGETRWIQLNTSNEEEYFTFALGYERKKIGHSYKILMWWNSENDITHERFNWFKIYEFRSDSWRVFDNVVIDFSIQSTCLSLKGNSYWLAYEKEDMYNEFLLCFDFTAERFKRMCLPPLDDVDQMSLSVVGEKQLSVLALRNSTSKMEIWITNKIDTDIEAVLKWSKSFAVDIPNICGDYDPRGLSFLIDEEKKVALCCYRSDEIGKNIASIIGEDDEYYREFLDAKAINDFRWYPYIFSYVPSLVQIQLS